ncbi:MAG TPA: CAP domain-containing protein [bacterium]|nr:CAP domain-containing protein [bacterium]HPS29312.1 CAP domain-containing protein [bacterium]
MLFQKWKSAFLPVFMVLFFFACNQRNDNIYSGDENAVNDSISDTGDDDYEYQVRPDSDHRPGGGGSETNNDIDYMEDDQDINNDDNDDINDEENNSIYSSEPDVAKCAAGTVSGNEKDIVLKRVNYIRSLHDLPPVVYKDEDDVYAAECALIIAANEELSHTPGSDWKCYSEDAYTGCNKSNIFIQWGIDPLLFKSKTVVDAFMTDEDVESLGHRRWLIDPWLAHISFGRADDFSKKITGAAIKVINTDEQDISGSGIEFVAYPYKYYPAEFYNENVMMSFTVIKDKMNKWNNDQVDFLTAAIAIKDPDNKLIKVSGKKSDSEGYGVPNNLRWYAQSVETGVKYNVTITNVLINNIPETFSYWFELK